MSDAKSSKAKAGKAAKGKNAKKGTKGKGATSGGPSVAGHPRAAAQVRRAKGVGGVGGFALAAYLGLSAGIPPDQVGLRALGAGVVGYLLLWACSVTVWRHLVMGELRALADEALAAAEAARPTRIPLNKTADPAPAARPKS